MGYRFQYETEYYRTLPACAIDARAGNPIIKNQIGDVIKQYTDEQTALITDGVLPYKIETGDNAVLVGFMSLDTTKTPVQVSQLFIRPAFNQFISEIQISISNFIKSNDWVYEQ